MQRDWAMEFKDEYRQLRQQAHVGPVETGLSSLRKVEHE